MGAIQARLAANGSEASRNEASNPSDAEPVERSTRKPAITPVSVVSAVSACGDETASMYDCASVPARAGASSGLAITSRNKGSCWPRVGELASWAGWGAALLKNCPVRRCSCSNAGSV